jgi:hypothetical protein
LAGRLQRQRARRLDVAVPIVPPAPNGVLIR